MKRSIKVLLVYWSIIGVVWFGLTLNTPMTNVEAGLTIAAAAVCVGGLVYIVMQRK